MNDMVAGECERVCGYGLRKKKRAVAAATADRRKKMRGLAVQAGAPLRVWRGRAQPGSVRPGVCVCVCTLVRGAPPGRCAMACRGLRRRKKE